MSKSCGHTVALAIIGILQVLGSTPIYPNTTPLCSLNIETMPVSWRPHGAVHKGLSHSDWTQAESELASHAVEVGFREIQDYLHENPASVSELGTNAVEALINISYAASNIPHLQRQARQVARETLSILIAPYMVATEVHPCGSIAELLNYTNYANALMDKDDPRLATLVALANRSIESCPSRHSLLTRDYRALLSSPGTSIDDLYKLVMWSIRITDAQTVKGLQVPDDLKSLPATLWRYLAGRMFANARDYPEGANDKLFYDTAYLVTHIAYIPTGYGRHPIYIEDAPWLYAFLRENFYAVLEMRELDLVAEFVDLFRQYGCTESNDLQLRDGTRFLLSLFQSAGGSWIRYREPGEPSVITHYDAIHKPWTGLAGVRARVPEPIAPGSYGEIVRTWLGSVR